MMKLLLWILVAALALAGIYAGWVALLFHALTTADPYPPFMTDYRARKLYADLERSFDQFITQRFPVGSNTQDAVATHMRIVFMLLLLIAANVDLLPPREGGSSAGWAASGRNGGRRRPEFARCERPVLNSDDAENMDRCGVGRQFIAGFALGPRCPDSLFL
jgi:hypothetical protein